MDQVGFYEGSSWGCSSHHHGSEHPSERGRVARGGEYHRADGSKRFKGLALLLEAASSHSGQIRFRE
jgi:hypothetical protein